MEILSRRLASQVPYINGSVFGRRVFERPARLARWFFIGSLVVTSFFAGCSEDEDPTDPGPDMSYGWNKLSVNPEWVTAIDLTPTHLVLAGGVSGVFIQSPAITGQISFAGSDFPNLYLGQLWYGAFRVAVLGDSLFRGFRLPVSHEPHVLVECGAAGPNFGTIPCSDGIIPGHLYDMIALPTGDLLICTTGALYRRSKNNSQWTVKVARTFFRCSFSTGGSSRLFMAYRSHTMLGTIYRSEDQGDSWQLITPAMPQGIQAADILSMATTSTGDTIIAATGTHLLLSTDGAASFSVSRPVPGGAVVFVSPQAPNRILAVADSLYTSVDMGATWVVTPIPGRRLLNETDNEAANRAAAIDWKTGRLVVGRLARDASEVWWYRFD